MLSGAVEHPGVLEVAHGTPLRQVLDHAGLRQRAPVLVGGFHGAWLAPQEVDVARFSRTCLDAYGASTGAGVLIVLPPGASGMGETARIAAYLAGQNARQCGPRLNGSRAWPTSLPASLRASAIPARPTSCTDSPGSRQAVTPATTPTAPYGSSVARCPSSFGPQAGHDSGATS